MATDLNKIIVLGRLTRDPELKFTNNGTPVAKFSIANNKSYTSNSEKKEEVSFFNCVAWSKLAELIEKYCTKGNLIGIEGRLQQRRWETAEGQPRSVVEIIADNVQFLTPKQEHQQQAPDAQDDNPFSDDDIPF